MSNQISSELLKKYVYENIDTDKLNLIGKNIPCKYTQQKFIRNVVKDILQNIINYIFVEKNTITKFINFQIHDSYMIKHKDFNFEFELHILDVVDPDALLHEIVVRYCDIYNSYMGNKVVI